MAEGTKGQIMNEKSPWHCPKCDERLVLKEGRYGRFMACPNYPDCQYTKALWTYQGVKAYCDKCNNTGLIPFKNKEGKTIPYTWIYCECHEEHEYYQPIEPSDFDFPMSYDFYRSLCQYHGWQDPGSCEMPETKEDREEPQPKTTVVIHRSAAKETQRITRLENNYSSLKKLFNERLEKKEKPFIKYK